MNKSSTIVVLANSLGGLFSFRKEIVKTLIDKGYYITIVAPPCNDSKGDYFREIGCHVENVNIDRRGTNPLKDLMLIWHYFQVMRMYRPLAVLTYTIKPNVYGGIISRLFHVPQIANITGLGTAIENPGPLQGFATFMYRWGLKKTRRVFCQNQLILDFCRKKNIGKERVLIPGSGVNLEWHTFQNYPRVGSTMKFNFIGRVMRDKGIEEFFEMAKVIRQKYPQTEFHILGRCEESYEEQLKELQEKGIVIWDGSVPDVRPFIKDSWATIHPSYHEGMANVLLETCAAGRPVIACNINGCKEAIDDGINGYVCKVKSVSDLMEKVERFILLPYEQKVQMGLAARNKVEREFDRSLVINAYLEEIMKCTNTSSNVF